MNFNVGNIFNNINPIQAVQGIQGAQKAFQSQNAGAISSNSNSLLDRLNGLDNKLLQGGGAKLPNMNANRINSVFTASKKSM